MTRRGSRVLVIVLLAAGASAQPATRRLATIGALRQFAGYYHLQNVLLRGEIVENGTRLMLRADDHEVRVILNDGVKTAKGQLEVRGQLVDVGRLEPGDPRVSNFAEERSGDRWPRPGEELFVRVSGISEAQPATTPSVRALALEPWKFVGQRVTIVGNFRGRNLFGDLPGAPRKTRYDFVLRGSEGAIWVTGLRPRAKGIELDVDRRLDTDRWLEVTGTVANEQGLVTIEATQLQLTKAPEIAPLAEENDGPPAPPPEPVEVVFSSPTDTDADVGAADPVRVQFSKGLDEKSIAGHVRVTYVGVSAADAAAPSELTFQTSYDAANRALVIRFSAPLERFRTVRVQILDGMKAFDGAPVKPWTLTFSVGG